MKRKSRKSRFNIALVSGPDPEFALSDAEWQGLEKELQYDFSQNDRIEIGAVINCYFMSYRVEQEAPFLAEMLRLSERITAASRDLLVVAAGQRVSDRDDGSISVRTLIAQGVPFAYPPAMSDRPKHMTWSEILRVLRHLSASSANVSDDLRSAVSDGGLATGYTEGDAWNAMIVKLTSLLKMRGARVGVSKGDTKRNSTSPFTYFVNRLQGHFPEKARRHASSLASLAEGIAKARRSLAG
jgi:hypothetical protein